MLEALSAEAEEDIGDDGAAERVAALEAELEQLAQDRAERLAQEVAELEARRAAAAAEAARGWGRRPRDGGRPRARPTPPPRRRAPRAASSSAPPRRRAARPRASAPSSPKVNQFLRAQAGAPGGAPALADALSAAPGYELALAAALGPRLRAAVAADLDEAARLLDRAGRDGGAALVAPRAPASGPGAPSGVGLAPPDAPQLRAARARRR